MSKEIEIQEFNELKPLVREKKLQKWVGIVNKLLEAYNVEDPQEVGLYNPYDPEEVYRFLLEYCHGLTESECYNRIEEEIAKHGMKEWEVSKRHLMEELDRLEAEAKEIELAVKRYRLPVDVSPDVAELLNQIYEKPDLNHDTVYDTVRLYLTQDLGWPEEEAEEVARKAAEVIDRVAKGEARPFVLAHWLEVMNYDYSRVRKSRKKEIEQARKLFRELVKPAGKPFLARITALSMYGPRVERAKSATIEEAVRKLQEYRRKGLRVRETGPEILILKTSPEYKVFYFEDGVCEIERYPQFKGIRIRRCTKPLLLTYVNIKRKELLYAIVEGEEK